MNSGAQEGSSVYKSPIYILPYTSHLRENRRLDRTFVNSMVINNEIKKQNTTLSEKFLYQLRNYYLFNKTKIFFHLANEFGKCDVIRERLIYNLFKLRLKFRVDKLFTS